MNYFGVILVEKNMAKEMECLCRNLNQDVKSDGTEFDKEYVFENGMRMSIQVCPAKNATCWTQGVLFTPDGYEVGCTDVGETFLGEYIVFDEENKYSVEVISKD